MHEGAGHAAAGSAAASVMLGEEVGKHAAAAFKDLGDIALVGAATAESYNLNSLHDESNSHGWAVDAATFQGDLGRAGAATVGDFSVSPGMYTFNTLHGWLNSQGLVADAATAFYGIWLRVPSVCMLSRVMDALPVSWGTLVALLSVAQTLQFMASLRIRRFIPSMHVHILVLMVVWLGVGVVEGLCTCTCVILVGCS